MGGELSISGSSNAVLTSKSSDAAKKKAAQKGSQKKPRVNSKAAKAQMLPAAPLQPESQPTRKDAAQYILVKLKPRLMPREDSDPAAYSLAQRCIDDMLARVPLRNLGDTQQPAFIESMARSLESAVGKAPDEASQSLAFKLIFNLDLSSQIPKLVPVTARKPDLADPWESAVMERFGGQVAASLVAGAGQSEAMLRSPGGKASKAQGKGQASAALDNSNALAIKLLRSLPERPSPTELSKYVALALAMRNVAVLHSGLSARGLNGNWDEERLTSILQKAGKALLKSRDAADAPVLTLQLMAALRKEGYRTHTPIIPVRSEAAKRLEQPAERLEYQRLLNAVQANGKVSEDSFLAFNDWLVGMEVKGQPVKPGLSKREMSSLARALTAVDQDEHPRAALWARAARAGLRRDPAELFALARELHED